MPTLFALEFFQNILYVDVWPLKTLNQRLALREEPVIISKPAVE
jgi:hypothetical protein